MIADADALLRVERLRIASPGAVELATLASPAVSIEPELLRSLRLTLLPRYDVGVESDLWTSDLVEARSHVGMTLRPGVGDVLRDRLRGDVDRGTARAAWDIIEDVHATLPPAIVHEEQLAWFSIDGGDIDGALKQALRSMAEQPDRNLAAWWMRARRRMPREVRESPIATALDRRAMAATGAAIAPEVPTDTSIDGVLASAGTRAVLVRRGERAVELGDFDPDVATVQIRVPDVEPVRVEVEAVDVPSFESFVATVRPNHSEVVAVPAGPIRLKSERGDVFEVGPATAEPTDADVLALGELFQAVLAGLGRLFPNLRVAGSTDVGTYVDDVVDPRWRRALRLLGDDLELEPTATFSQFARACMLRLASSPDLVADVESLAERLSVYDDWQPATLDPAHDELQDTVTEVQMLFDLDLQPAEGELRGSRDWIVDHLHPPWRRHQAEAQPESEGEVAVVMAYVTSLDELVRRFADAWSGVTGDDDVESDPVGTAAIDYLRRQRPDFAVTPRPTSDRLALVAPVSETVSLVEWLGEKLAGGIEALVRRRSSNGHGAERAVPLGSVDPAVAISGDGSLAAVCIDGRVELCDLVEGTRRTTLGTGGDASAVAVSATGGMAFVGSASGALTAWDLSTMEIRATVQCGSSALVRIAAKDDGGLVVALSADRTVYRWDGERSPSLVPVGRAPRAFAYATDGDVLAVLVDEPAPLELWSMAYGTMASSIAVVDADLVSVDARGSSIVTVDIEFGTLSIFDSGSSEPIGPPEPAPFDVTSIAPTVAAGVVFAGGAGGQVASWSLADLPRVRVGDAHPSDVTDVALTSDGQRGVSVHEDGMLVVWDIPSMKDVTRFRVFAEGTVGGTAGDYPTINEAVDRLGPGAVIHLREGEYHEHVELLPGQRLLGPETGTAVIDGEGKGFVVAASANCRIENLTIRNGGGETGVIDCGVMIEDCRDVVVSNCRVVDNGHYGIVLRRSESQIVSSTIASNAVLGIYVDEDVESVIHGNLFADHRHSAVDIEGSLDGRFTHNTVVRCGTGVFGPSARGTLQIENNIFFGNDPAVRGDFADRVRFNLVEDTRGWRGSGDDVVPWPPDSGMQWGDPQFVDVDAGDYRITATSPARSAIADGRDLGAYPFLGADFPFVGPDGEPAEPPLVYLLYVRDDREAAAQLDRDLRAYGLRTWDDRRDIVAGAEKSKKIERVIRVEADVVVVVQSAAWSSAEGSAYAEQELRMALDREMGFRRKEGQPVFIVPVVLDDPTNGIDQLDHLQFVDLSRPSGLVELIEAIRRTRSSQKRS